MAAWWQLCFYFKSLSFCNLEYLLLAAATATDALLKLIWYCDTADRRIGGSLQGGEVGWGRVEAEWRLSKWAVTPRHLRHSCHKDNWWCGPSDPAGHRVTNVTPHHICRKITLYSAGAGCEYWGLYQTLLPGSTSTFSLDEDFQSESEHQFPCKSLSPLVTTRGSRAPCPVSCSPLVCVTPAPGPLQISSDMWGREGPLVCWTGM